MIKRMVTGDKDDEALISHAISNLASKVHDLGRIE